MVRGTVFGGAPVAGATVAFLEAGRAGVASSLQPLEDLARDARFRAVTDLAGEYSIEVDAGRYFVHVTPAPGDVVHLPGGSLSRTSVSLGAGQSPVLDITLSETPSATAAYVGSTTCLSCHPEQAGTTETLHFVGLRELTSTGSRLSSLQDLARFPDAHGALSFFVDGNASDNTGAGDGFGQRIATLFGYSVLLGVDASGHFQALESSDRSRVSERLYIPFTYGGEGRFRHRFVTRLDRDGRYTASPASGTYHVLPAQYTETTGDPTRGFEVTTPTWVTYRPERWAAPTLDGGPVGSTPAPENSFDHDCAGCHFTGMTLNRNADGLFQASAVADPGGPIDFDGDGQLDEMNIGCERCHGPGSEHAAAGEGLIVQPAYLPPGRANLICGQCHIRGTGNGMLGGAGGSNVPSRNDPGTGGIEFVRPGLSPAEFFGTPDGTGILPGFGTSGGYLDPVDLTTDGAASWRDRTLGFGADLDHSRDQVQHFLDHARSRHFANSLEKLACFDCHDSHGRQRRAQVAEPVDNNVLCLRCHAGRGDWKAVDGAMVDGIETGDPPPEELLTALDHHQAERIFDLIGVAMRLGPSTYGNPAGSSRLGRCTTCHMPKTARNGSWITDDEGFVIRGDISSHTFDVVSPRVSQAMALDGREPVPNSCADCHRGLLRGAYPDYRHAR